MLPSSGVASVRCHCSLPLLRERAGEPARRRGRPRLQDVRSGGGEHRVVREVAADDDRPGVARHPRGALGEDAVDLGPRLGGILRVVVGLVARVGRAGRHVSADVGNRGPALRAPVERGPGRVEPARRDVVAVLVPRHLLGRDSADHLVGEGDVARPVAPERVRLARRRQLGGGDHRDRHGCELGAVRHRREELGPAAAAITGVRERIRDTNRDARPVRRHVATATERRVGVSPGRRADGPGCCRSLPAEHLGFAGRALRVLRLAPANRQARTSPARTTAREGRRGRIDGSIGDRGR